ncbi:MAG: FecR domain-containing protein [Balneolaceae bacterium]|nr:FecR domain-containing protein [Balneolaceae bacterium]
MKIDKQWIEKYFDGTASQEEADKILHWFQTKEGREFLNQRFEDDINNEVNAFWQDSSEGVKSLNKIHSRINASERVGSRKYSRRSSSVWAVAACIAFLIATVVVWEFQNGFGTSGYDGPAVSLYSTTDSEHRVITMSDGSRVRLNENSEIEIPDYFTPELRSVRIRGEAFFEISPDEARPFVVNADETQIQVLGTAFMVRSATPSQKTMVAVREGKISFGASGMSTEAHKILEKNMIGFYDRDINDVTVEEIAITNYLTWMHGRVIFDRTPFPEVLRQLVHIYNIEHEVADEEINNLVLTADFSERSLDNVLETIAHSLGIRSVRNGDIVKWSANQ